MSGRNEILRFAQDDNQAQDDSPAQVNGAGPLVRANMVPETPLFRSICFNRMRNTDIVSGVIILDEKRLPQVWGCNQRDTVVDLVRKGRDVEWRVLAEVARLHIEDRVLV